MAKAAVLLAALISLWTIGQSDAQVLAPRVINVARGKRIEATSTCGVDEAGNSVTDDFCLLTLTRDSGSAAVCDVCRGASGPRAHPASLTVDGTNQDWISPPLSRGEKHHEVNLTLDLGQEFHVAYVFVQAKRAPRPGQWILEKSSDGITYTPWQYFVQSERDCQTLYGIDPNEPLTDTSPRCTAGYSDVSPLNNGEVYARLLFGRPSEDDFTNSPALQDFSSARFIRLRLLRVTTLLGELLTPFEYTDETLSRRYFYSISDIQVSGRCKCNGFADECKAVKGNELLVCQCVNNTCGADCSQCCPGFNQYQWRQKREGDDFSCQKCNCFGHSDECTYDESVNRQSQSINLAGSLSGGGRCLNCRDNTMGINCDTCLSTHFRSASEPKTNPCRVCRCSGPGALSDATCNAQTGQCNCKRFVEGFSCDKCKPGYFGLDRADPDGCRPCGCDPEGSLVGLKECGTDTTGACACKPLVTTATCGECVKGSYGLSGDSLFGCSFCLCNVGGSLDPFGCNPNKGKCKCRDHMKGKKCDQIEEGYYLPTVQTKMFGEAEDGKWNNYKTPFGFNETEFPGYSSFGYVILMKDGQESISLTFQIPKAGKHQIVVYYILEGSKTETISTFFTPISPSGPELNVTIPLSPSGQPRFSDIAQVGREYSLKEGEWLLTVEYKGSSRLLLDRVIVVSDVYYNPSGLVTNVPDMCQLDQSDNLCRRYGYPDLSDHRNQAGIQAALRPTPLGGKLLAKLDLSQDQLGFMFLNVPAGSYAVVVAYFSQHPEPLTMTTRVQSDVESTGEITLYPCPFSFGCRHVAMDRGEVLGNVVQGSGAVAVTLTLLKKDDNSEMAFVESVFLVPMESFDAAMVTPSFVCFVSNSQCLETPSEQPVSVKDRFLTDCSANAFDINDESTPFCKESVASLSAISNDGARQCQCNVNGSTSSVCDSLSGACPCKPDVVGFSCTRCKVGFYGFPNCQPCACASGTVCDEVTGNCVCPPNVIGQNCDTCERRFWKFHPTEGCINCECDPIGSRNFRCSEETGQCRCKDGYAGLKCSECAPGKFNPPICGDCGCDPRGSASINCHQSTGQCNCKANMGILKCSVCNPGSFNYSSTNPDGCQLCECDPVGSLGQDCEVITGLCQCKANVIGRTCDRCVANMFRTTDGSCAPCDCDPVGSKSPTCDVANGKCRCQKFVRGRQCDRCLKGYFNLTSSGCKSCECDPLGSSGYCDLLTGECVCAPGAFGRRCDQCKARHVVSPQGCRPCGYCTDSLLDDMEKMTLLANGTLLNISDYSFLVAAWNRLRDVRKRFNVTRTLLCGKNCDAFSVIPPPPMTPPPPPTGGSSLPFLVELARLDGIIGRMDPEIGLVALLAKYVVDLAGLELRAAASLDDGVEAKENVMNVLDDAVALLKQFEDENGRLKDAVDDLRDFIDSLRNGTLTGDSALATGRDILNKMKQKDFDTPLQDATKLINEANMVLQVAEDALAASSAYLGNATDIQQKLTDWVEKLKEAKSFATDLTDRANASAANVTALEDQLDQLRDDVIALDKAVEELKNNVTSAMYKNLDALQRFQYAKDAHMCAKDNTTQMSADLKAFRQEIFDFMQKFSELQLEALKAERNASDLRKVADRLAKMWAEANGEFGECVDLFQNYELINITAFIMNLTIVPATSGNASTEAMRFDIDDLRRKARESLNESRRQSNEAMECKAQIQDINSRQSNLNDTIANVKKDLDQNKLGFDALNLTIQDLSKLSNDPTEIQRMANESKGKAEKERKELEEDKVEVQQLEDRLNELLRNITPGTSNLDLAEQNTSLATIKVADIHNDSTILKEKFIELDSRLSKLDKRVIDIQAKIKLFRDHASRIDIPIGLKQNDGDVVTPVMPMLVSDRLFQTTVDLNIRPTSGKDTGLILFMGPGGNDGSRRKRGAGATEPFFAIELRQGRVKTSFSLGEEVGIMQTNALVLDGVGTYRIEARRNGRNGEMNVGLISSGGEPVRLSASGQALGVNLWMDFGSKPVLFVGGIPDDFQLPPIVRNLLTNQNYDGCITSLAIDGQSTSLVNFNNFTQGIAPTCDMDLKEEKLPSSTSSSALYGLGYLAFDPTVEPVVGWNTHSNGLILDISGIRTTQWNALIFYASGDGDAFLSLEIYNGGLRAVMHNDLELVEVVMPNIPGLSQSQNMGEVSIYTNGEELRLRAKGDDKSAMAKKPQAITITSPLYFGGVPEGVAVGKNVSRISLRACFSKITMDFGPNFTPDKKVLKVFGVGNVEGSNGYGFQCLNDVVLSAMFDGVGRSEYQVTGLAQNGGTIALKLKPKNETGVVMFHQDGDDDYYYTVALLDGQVRFYIGQYDTGSSTEAVMSNGNVNLGEVNYLVIRRVGARVTMTLNDKESSASGFLRNAIPPADDSSATFNLGGVGSAAAAELKRAGQVTKPYEGCLEEVSVGQSMVNFIDTVRATSANIRIPCQEISEPTPTPSQGLVDVTPSPPAQPAPECAAEPQLDLSANCFGGAAGAKLEYVFTDKKIVQKGFNISFVFRTSAERAKLLAVTDNSQDSYVFAKIDDGKITFSFSMGVPDQQMEVTMDTAINDNEWHKVTLYRKVKTGYIVVDGVKSANKKFTGDPRNMQLTGPFTFGDILSLKKKHKTYKNLPNFNGCMKNIEISSIDGDTQTLKTFDDTIETGLNCSCYPKIEIDSTGFYGDASFVLYTSAWTVTAGTVIRMSVRSNRPSGLLLSVGGAENSDPNAPSYVVLEIRQGTLFFVVNNGAGEFLISDTSGTNLCDGKWHSIEAVLNGNRLQMKVDEKTSPEVQSSSADGNNEAEGPLYVGGLKNDVNRAGKFVTTGNLHGCIKDFYADRDRPLDGAAELVGITLRQCPISG